MWSNPDQMSLIMVWKGF